MRKTKVRLVKNNPVYFDFIRKLRNNKIVKTGFIVEDYITKAQQRKYMQKYANNYYICLNNEEPVGYIGQIDGDIRLAVVPKEQGKGIGKFMVKNFIKLYPNVFAKIKLENTASLRLFRSCGFKEKYIILEAD